MRQQGLLVGTLLLVLPFGAAVAAPIPPAKDKPGTLMAYQRLGEADRRATLEAFTGVSMASDSLYESFDACTMRQTTDDGAGRLTLSKAVSACSKELGVPAAGRQASTTR